VYLNRWEYCFSQCYLQLYSTISTWCFSN